MLRSEKKKQRSTGDRKGRKAIHFTNLEFAFRKGCLFLQTLMATRQWKIGIVKGEILKAQHEAFIKTET